MNKIEARNARAALVEAVLSVGGPKKLGEALGISGPAVSQWKVTPPKRVPDVSRITGIPRHRLRPDLYDAP